MIADVAAWNAAMDAQRPTATSRLPPASEFDAVRAMPAAGGPPEQTREDRARWALADLVAPWGQAIWAGDLTAVKRLKRRLPDR